MPLMDPRNKGCPPKFSWRGWDFLSLNLQTNQVFLYWVYIHCMTHSHTKLLKFYKIVPECLQLLGLLYVSLSTTPGWEELERGWAEAVKFVIVLKPCQVQTNLC